MKAGDLLQPGSRMTAGAWFDPARGQICEQALARLAGSDVVLLGEKHDEAEHHRWQLHTIAGLHCLRNDVVLGFEMFPRRVQPVLDRWAEGEMSEAAFLDAVDWPRVWGVDPALYLPLFHFARMQRIPMLALNVDRDTNRLVASRGLDTLSAAEREHVGDPSPPSAAYRERLFGWFSHHPAFAADTGMDSPRFDRFVRAQQFWDRAMAEALAAALTSPARRPLVIGVMGRGHVEYGDGVPHQLAALGLSAVATALPWNLHDEPPTATPIASLLFAVDLSGNPSASAAEAPTA
jgi:uncharacterized iron-regulated protein